MPVSAPGQRAARNALKITMTPHPAPLPRGGRSLLPAFHPLPPLNRAARRALAPSARTQARVQAQHAFNARIWGQIGRAQRATVTHGQEQIRRAYISPTGQHARVGLARVGRQSIGGITTNPGRVVQTNIYGAPLTHEASPFSIASHLASHAGGALYHGLGLGILRGAAGEAVHGRNPTIIGGGQSRAYEASLTREQQRARAADRAIAESTTGYREIMHPGAHPYAAAFDILSLVPFIRGGRAFGELIKAGVSVDQASRILPEASQAAVRSWRANEGLIRPALAAARRTLPGPERDLARNAARRAHFAQIDATNTPEDAKALKRTYDQFWRAQAKRGTARNVREAVGGLVEARAPNVHAAEPDIAALYQHDLPPAPEMPARLAVKGMPHRIYKLVQQGAQYRDWYKRAAVVLTEHANHLGISSQQMAAITAITSQQANPTFNLRRAIQAVREYQTTGRIDPEIYFKGQAEKITQILEDPNSFDWQGLKTNHYFGNFLQHMDPALHAKLGLHQNVTVDRHMAEMFLGKQSVTDKQYEQVRQIMIAAGEKLGWDPSEVQAAAWVTYKAGKIGTTEQIKALGRALKKAGEVPEEFLPKAGMSQKEKLRLGDLRSAWTREQFAAGRRAPGWEKPRPVQNYLPSAGDAYEVGGARFAPGGSEPLYQRHEMGQAPTDTFNPKVAQVTSEIRPEHDFWPERAAIFDSWNPTQKAAYAKLVDHAVGTEFEKALGMQAVGQRDGMGIWRGVATPGIAHHVLLDGELTDGTRAELDALAAAKGMAKHQISVSWGIPKPLGEGEFNGIHWKPPEGADPARASAAMDVVAGPGNVAFIHAPDGGFYVVDFQGKYATRSSTETAIRNLGGEQTRIGWDGGYTIDKRKSTEPWETTYQEALAKLPAEKRSALELAMVRVRARVDAIDEEAFGRPGAKLVNRQEADALAKQGTHVFHGAPGTVPEQIMAERRLRVGGAHPEAAWMTTDPAQAEFYTHGYEPLPSELDKMTPSARRNILAIPRDQIPFGEANAPHPFGAFGSPEDVLFQKPRRLPPRLGGQGEHLGPRFDPQYGTLDEQINRLLLTRDMRYYGINQQAFNTADKYHFGALAAAKPVEDGQKIAEAYRQGLPHLDEASKHEILAKLKQAPPLPESHLLQEAGAPKGAFVRHGGGHYSIHLYQGEADVSTSIHELGHAMRAVGTTPAEEAVLAKEFGAVKQADGSFHWTRDAEEGYARAVEWAVHSGTAPRNLVLEWKRLQPQFRKLYAAGELTKPSQAVQDIIKAQLGHENGSALLHFLVRHGRVAAGANRLRPGPPRSAEEAQAHIADAVAHAENVQGYGTKSIDIAKLKPGEAPEAQGGALGERIRAHQAGRAPEGAGVYERVGTRSMREARAEQQALRTPALGRKAAASASSFSSAGGGLKGYYAGMKELQGKLPTVQMGSLGDLNPDAVDTLINFIEHHPAVEGKVFLRRRAQSALLDLIDGKTIQLNEEKLLTRLFGREVSRDTILRQIRAMSKMDIFKEMINLPRSLVATLDQSMMFRHGIMTLAHSPNIWIKQFPPMYKALFSEASAQNWKHALQSFETFALADKGGTQFTEIGSDLAKREEQYMSVLAEQIPGIGRIVRASDRSYVGTLNAMRMGLFDKLVRQAAMQGWDVNDQHLLDSIGKFVNSATGRGDLGLMRKHAVTLQSTLFSARLLASRINFLSPFYYASLHPFARKEAWKALRNLTIGATTFLGALKMAGVNVVDDPRNSDFGKMKFGNTRIDLLGGFQQPIVLAARMLTSTSISSSTQRPIHLSGKAFGLSQWDILFKFFENKLSPVPSGMVSALQQKDALTGQPLSKGNFVPNLHHPLGAIEKNFMLSRLVPLVVQDIAGLPGAEKAYLAPVAALGIGASSYGPPPAGEKRLSTIEQKSRDAGLGKPPAAVLQDAHWKGALDNATYAGQSNFDRMKAAAEVFDQRYGTNLEKTLTEPGKVPNDAAAAKVYSELAPKIAPVYDHWLAAADKVLKAKAGAAPTPTAPPAVHKSSAPVTPTAPALQPASYHIPIGGASHLGAHELPAAHGLPPELASAISSAASKFGVPASTLTGIWRIESGSTYPNPAVNSSGYGGLFGTTQWRASTQHQADYAALTLRHLLDSHGGNMAAALHAYSGGGYTSVPGAGGAWHAGGGGGGAGMAAGGPQFASLTTGGGDGAGATPGLDSVAESALQALASGTYSPSVALTKTLEALSARPLQGNVQGINFELPKGGKAAPAARGAIALAEAYLGTPYVWGGESPSGFDCSGLLQFIYGKQGITIPRTSQAQYQAGRRVGRGQLRPGDAVFFVGSDGTRQAPGHEGIYIGGGRFIEAPHSGTTVRVSNLRSAPGFVGARRFTR